MLLPRVAWHGGRRPLRLHVAGAVLVRRVGARRVLLGAARLFAGGCPVALRGLRQRRVVLRGAACVGQAGHAVAVARVHVRVLHMVLVLLLLLRVPVRLCGPPLLPHHPPRKPLLLLRLQHRWLLVRQLLIPVGKACRCARLLLLLRRWWPVQGHRAIGGHWLVGGAVHAMHGGQLSGSHARVGGPRMVRLPLLRAVGAGVDRDSVGDRGAPGKWQWCGLLRGEVESVGGALWLLRLLLLRLARLLRRPVWHLCRCLHAARMITECRRSRQ